VARVFVTQAEAPCHDGFVEALCSRVILLEPVYADNEVGCTIVRVEEAMWGMSSMGGVMRCVAVNECL
jgi:hypothetical protein